MAGKWYVKLPVPMYGEQVEEKIAVEVSETQVVIAQPGDFILTHASGQREVVLKEVMLNEYQEIDIPQEPPTSAKS